MKTKELIAQLQKLDPSGEDDVCIDNNPIIYCDMMEHYWNGPLLQIEEIVDCKVTKAKFSRAGNQHKIMIIYKDLEEMIYQNPDIVIDTSELNSSDSRTIRIEEIREDANKNRLHIWESPS